MLDGLFARLLKLIICGAGLMLAHGASAQAVLQQKTCIKNWHDRPITILPGRYVMRGAKCKSVIEHELKINPVDCFYPPVTCDISANVKAPPNLNRFSFDYLLDNKTEKMNVKNKSPKEVHGQSF